MTKLKQLPAYVFLTIMSLLSVFPFYWMIVSATNTSNDIANGRMIPGAALFENFAALTERMNFLACLRNSLIIAIIATVLNLLFSSMAGYGFEVFHDNKKDRLMGLVLTGMMIPAVATMIPLFKMFSEVNLINSLLACILPSMTTITIIFLFRQGSRSFPTEIIQAARIDGLSEFGIFFRVYFPVMRSTYATGFIIAFMSSWNNYMWPRLVLLQNDKATLPIMINNLLSGYTPNYGAVMLGCTIYVLPMLTIFMCMQQSFVNGVSGSVKG